MEFEDSPIKVGVFGAYAHFEKSALFYMFRKQKITVVKNIKDHEDIDIIVVWDPWGRVKKNKKKMAILKAYGRGKKKINFKLKSCQKDYTTEIFDEMFEQKLGINPQEYKGYAVAKHNDNGTKSCFFIKCPLDADEVFENHIYQKIIDFRHPFDNEILCEIRVPIFGGIVPFVFFKERARGLRFTSKNRKVSIANVEDHLTENEVEEIQKYCRKVGLEYGDLDVLRGEDGLIYIIDVNNTPWWPPNKLFNRDRNIALNIFWNAWLKAFIPSLFESLRVPDDEIDDYVPPAGHIEKFNDEIGLQHVIDPREHLKKDNTTETAENVTLNKDALNSLMKQYGEQEYDEYDITEEDRAKILNEIDTQSVISKLTDKYSINSRNNHDVEPSDSTSNVGSKADRIYNQLKLW